MAAAGEENPHHDSGAEEEEEDAQDTDVGSFLEAWGVTAGGRRPKRARYSFNVSRAYPGFQFADSVRHQVVSTLVAGARHFAATRNDAALAATLATLLQAEHPSRLTPGTTQHFRNIVAYSRMSEVLLTAVDLAQRHPGNYDATLRVLRRARLFQHDDAGKAAVGVAMGRFILGAGHTSDAYDALAAVDAPAGCPAALQRRLLMGGIRRSQWETAMREAVPGGRWSPLAPATQAWARAGRSAKDLATDVQTHYTAALEIDPGRTDAALALAELAMAQGRREDALSAARAQCDRAPVDADAHGLTLALLLSGERPRRRDQAAEAVLRAETVERCVSLLRTTFGTHVGAARVLLSVEQALPQSHPPPVELLPIAEGLSMFLDAAAAPALRHTGVVLQAWQTLAGVIIQVSEAVVTEFRAAENARKELRVRGSEAAAVALVEARRLLDAALERYYAMQMVLREHEWWLDTHLALREGLGCALQQGTADPTTVAALAVVQAGLVYAVAAENGRMARLGLASPPATAPSDALAIAAAALRSAPGNSDDDAAALIEVAKSTVLQAPGAVAAVEEAAAAGAAAAAAWRHAGPQGAWDPAPPGAAHPELGFISPLPAPWWSTFPQVRRAARTARAAAVAEAEAAAQQQLLATQEFEARQQERQSRRVRFALPGAEHGTQAESGGGIG